MDTITHFNEDLGWTHMRIQATYLKNGRKEWADCYYWPTPDDGPFIFKRPDGVDIKQAKAKRKIKKNPLGKKVRVTPQD
ncbi:hypothetical protein [Pseudoxanthomonas winnipegensis]|uniref:Uncharacterized protein n=1 Tax=Pseudoxanthomonas winnipegensis TaxID=2480810 RepID=A0A4Q8M4I4_9GAMM|nr:hypothetical protein [Pseudoxanthomonas winnipegensis]TAA41565.1 hypothetical protein EA655_11525 [Pseudoxanthomonas winnipegensis]